jgi:hypothetical protein
MYNSMAAFGKGMITVHNRMEGQYGRGRYGAGKDGGRDGEGDGK